MSAIQKRRYDSLHKIHVLVLGVGAGGGCAPSHTKHASFWICTFVEFKEVHSLTVLMLTTKIKNY